MLSHFSFEWNFKILNICKHKNNLGNPSEEVISYINTSNAHWNSMGIKNIGLSVFQRCTVKNSSIDSHQNISNVGNCV